MFSLKPSYYNDFILNPWVGTIVDKSSSDNAFKIVVLPAIAKPPGFYVVRLVLAFRECISETNKLISIY
jgi:hypothetical protein